MSETINVTHWVDVHYSPDDDGWYAANYDPSTLFNLTSEQTWPTSEEAITAVLNGEVRWES